MKYEPHFAIIHTGTNDLRFNASHPKMPTANHRALRVHEVSQKCEYNFVGKALNVNDNVT